MMKRTFLIIVSCLSLCAAAFPAETPKLAIIADFGQKGLPDEIADFALMHPALRIAFVWQPGQKISETAALLVKNGQFEPVPALYPEPVMPLVCEVRISTPVSAEFAWPDDIFQEIFALQQEYRTAWGAEPSGLYVRSGMMDKNTADKLTKLGVQWVNAVSSGAAVQACRRGDIAVFRNSLAASDSAEQSWKDLLSSSSTIAVLFLDKPATTRKEYVFDLAGKIESVQGAAVILPSEIAKTGGPYAQDLPLDNSAFNSDFNPWLKNPVIWQRLAVTRAALEDYKNSGQAQVPVLDAAKGEIFGLYEYKLLKSLNENPGGREEQFFQAGISNVYRLIKKNMPAEMTESISKQADAGGLQAFSLTTTSNGIIFRNSADPEKQFYISVFEVIATTRSVEYKVSLGSEAAAADMIVDIYIDMNNKRDAGLVKFLPGAEAYLKPQDAWEFAVRFEKGEMKLYRFGRSVPSLAKKERNSGRTSVNISKTILRGNPLSWGYQVVLMTRKDELSPFAIEDFLCPENLRSDNLLKKTPVELPALRMAK